MSKKGDELMKKYHDKVPIVPLTAHIPQQGGTFTVGNDRLDAPDPYWESALEEGYGRGKE